MTIRHNPEITRKDGLKLLGEGCKNCNVREKCFIDNCNCVVKTRYEGMTDLGSDYMYYKNAGFEVYIREYRKAYCLIVKGEKFKSGERDYRWQIHVYNKDRKVFGHLLFDDSEVKDGYIKRKYMGYHYGLADKIPLKDSSVIIY